MSLSLEHSAQGVKEATLLLNGLKDCHEKKIARESQLIDGMQPQEKVDLLMRWINATLQHKDQELVSQKALLQESQQALAGCQQSREKLSSDHLNATRGLQKCEAQKQELQTEAAVEKQVYEGQIQQLNTEAERTRAETQDRIKQFKEDNRECNEESDEHLKELQKTRADLNSRTTQLQKCEARKQELQTDSAVQKQVYEGRIQQLTDEAVITKAKMQDFVTQFNDSRQKLVDKVDYAFKNWEQCVLDLNCCVDKLQTCTTQNSEKEERVKDLEREIPGLQAINNESLEHFATCMTAKQECETQKSQLTSDAATTKEKMQDFVTKFKASRQELANDRDSALKNWEKCVTDLSTSADLLRT